MAEQSPATEKQSFNPSSLTISEAARLLSRASGEAITEAMIRADLGSGAPTNPDGTIHLVHYTAWLVQNSKRTSIGD